VQVVDWPVEISWWLRSRLTWSPRVRRKCGVRDLEGVELGFDTGQQARLGELAGRYELGSWATCSAPHEYRENLYLLYR